MQELCLSNIFPLLGPQPIAPIIKPRHWSDPNGEVVLVTKLYQDNSV